MNKYIIGFLIGIITAHLLMYSIYYEDGVNAGIKWTVDLILTDENYYNEICGQQGVNNDYKFF